MKIRELILFGVFGVCLILLSGCANPRNTAAPEHNQFCHSKGTYLLSIDNEKATSFRCNNGNTYPVCCGLIHPPREYGYDADACAEDSIKCAGYETKEMYNDENP